MKRCSKCKVEKELTEFSKAKRNKDGLYSQCKSCVKEYQQQNKERYKERAKEYREQNKEHIRQRSKEWRKQNKEHIRQRNREYMKKWREKNKERQKTYSNKRQKNHSEEQRKLGKCVYLHKNPKTKEVFYVGIGRECRAYNFKFRSIYWKNYVNSNGVEVDIIYKGLSVEEAVKKEVKLIKKYGRKDLGKGSLMNRSNGGEGSRETEANHNSAIKCYCLKTQKIYNSVMEFSDLNNYTYSTIIQFLKNIKKNRSKNIKKDYYVREVDDDGSVVWHSSEKFVRSDFENIDEFKDVEIYNHLDSEEIHNLYKEAIDKFIACANGFYKKEQQLPIFESINNGLSFNDASDAFDLSYHQVYNSYNSIKEYLYNYILDRYDFWYL